MSATAKDHPDVVIFPPLIVLTTVLLAIVLQWLWPLGAVALLSQIWRITIGTILIALGAAVTISGRLALIRRGTNVNPLRPTTVVVTHGIYQWTRNPMYTGVGLVIVGAALVFALDWLLLLLPTAYRILHVAVVRREEQYLEHKFGPTYREYKAQVPRYAGPFCKTAAAGRLIDERKRSDGLAT